MADVKFCGLTRPQDAREAVRLGARYLGIIFAGGPRLLDPARAQTVLADVPPGVERVGVFGAGSAESIARTARDAGVDIVQLHADPTPDLVRAVRADFAGPVWAVIRVAGDVIPAGAAALFSEADAVVLDARSDEALGGTGRILPWSRLAIQLRTRRGSARLAVAGGLNPGNVAEAIELLAPDIVDISSGVESAPGVKDHSLMSAFMEAARSSTRQP
jgi:phosphoribosylanthranilate isomerase